MKKIFLTSFLIPIGLSVFISIFFIPFFNNETYSLYSSLSQNTFPQNPAYDISKNTTFIWPLPGYTKITSKFGYRKAPTDGAAIYHGGIDIAAPESSNILSIADGTIYYVGWYGANGYTVIVEHEDGFKSTYGHVSPSFLVKVGDSIKKGDLIAKVGPKYIDKKSYTTYKDSTGKYTNGATTGPHLHFAISQNNKKIDPEELY